MVDERAFFGLDTDIPAKVGEINDSLTQLGNVSPSGGLDATLRRLNEQVTELRANARQMVTELNSGGTGGTAYERVVLGGGAAPQLSAATTELTNSITAAASSFFELRQIPKRLNEAMQREVIEAARGIGPNAGKAFQLPSGEVLTRGAAGEAAFSTTGTRLGPLATSAAFLRGERVNDQAQRQVERESVAAQKQAATEARQAATEARRAAQAQEAAGRAAGGGGRGGPPGIIGSFGRGFSSGGFFGGDQGSIAADLALTSGILLKYQLLGRAVSGLFDGARAVREELAKFSFAEVELNEALGSGNEATVTYTQSLSDLAATAGQSASEGLTAATRAIEQFTDSQTSAEEKRRVGLVGARGARDASILQGRDISKSTADVFAAAQSFELGVDGINRVNDAIENAKQNFGVAAADISNALALISDVGKEAGFTVEETANIISQASARTGTSGQQVAGDLKRVIAGFLSQEGQKQLTAVGVDTTQTVADQLRQLAQIYPTLGQAQRSAFEASIGGRRSLSVLLPLLQDYNALLDANAQSLSNQGAAQSQVEKDLNSLGGRLRQFGGILKEIAKDLGQSGVLAPLALLLAAAMPLLQLFDSLLKTFNQLPSAARTVALGILEIALAMKLLNGARSGGSFLGGLGGLGGRAAGRAAASEATGWTAVGEAGAAGIGGFGAGVVAAAPAIAVVAALVAIGGLTHSVERLDKAMGRASDATDSVAKATSADDYLTTISSLRAARIELEHSRGGVFGRITNVFSGDAAGKEIRELRGLERFAESQRESIVAEQRAKAPELAQYYVNTGNAVEDVRRALNAMTRDGIGAARQLDILTASIRGLAGGSQRPPGLYGGAQGLARVGSTIAGLGVTEEDLRRVYGEHVPARYLSPVEANRQGTAPLTAATTKNFDRQIREIQAAVNRRAAELGLNSDSVLTPEQRSKLAEAGAEVLKLDNENWLKAASSPEQRKALHDLLVQKAVDAINKLGVQSSTPPVFTAADFHRLIAGETDAKDPGASLPSAEELFKSQEALVDPRDPKALQQLRASQIRYLRAQIERGRQAGANPADLVVAERLLQGLLDEQTKSLIADYEKMREAAAYRARGKPGELAAVARRFAQLELGTALDAGDASAVIEAINSFDEKTVRFVITQLRAQVAIRRAALEATKRALQQITDFLANQPRGRAEAEERSGNDGSAQQEAVNKAKAAFDAQNKQLQMLLGAYQNYYTGGPDTSKQFEDIAALARQAAVFPGSALDQARADLFTAQRALARTSYGSADYYRALKDLRVAQVALADAEREYANQLHTNLIDITDPVAKALEELREARAKLAQHRAEGAPGDVIAKDVGDVRSAEAQAEAAKFSQRLSDMQIAEQLGRISHQAYIRYLENEHNRLLAIAHRTRQQQDELNQIDLLLKQAADELQGQFNIGDIKLPTIYEVRRSIQSQAAGIGYQDNRTVSITVNGADLAQLQAVLDQYLGSVTTNRVSTSTRKI